MNISRSKSNTQTSVFLYIHGMFHLILKLFNDGHKCPSNIFNFMEENMINVIILYNDISKYGTYTVSRKRMVVLVLKHMKNLLNI
jgi:hypothetical protein